MTKHINYPSIEQFRATVKKIKGLARQTVSGQLPTIAFRGTVKLHGSNGATSAYINKPEEFWYQSRSQIISAEKDNCGMARLLDDNRTWVSAAMKAATDHFQAKGSYSDECVVSIFGEICGSNTQKNVALEHLPRMFVVFGVSIWTHTDQYGQDQFDWAGPTDMRKIFESAPAPDNVKFIHDFPVKKMDIDFNRPEISQNALAQYTLEVEKCCPVAHQLGVDGVGEGAVWSAFPEDNPHIDFKLSTLTYKVKGSEHSDTKVKTLAAVDVERSNSLHEFAQSVCTDHRLEKMIDKMKETGTELALKSTPDFLKLAMADVLKEETDTITASGFVAKDVAPVVSKLVRAWYVTRLRAA